MVSAFLSYFKPHKKKMTFVLSMVFVYTIAELLLPIFARTILNTYIPNGDMASVLKISVLMVVIIIFYAIARYVVTLYGHVWGTAMESDMRLAAFSKLQKLSFAYFDKNKTGNIMSRLTSDLVHIAEFAHHGCEEVLSVILMLTLGFIFLVRINFLMTLIIFAITFGMLGGLLYTRRGSTSGFRKLRNEHAEINSQLEGALSGIRLTRTFANESFEEEKFAINNQRYIDVYRVAYQFFAQTMAFNNLFVQVLNVSVLFFGAIFVLQGTFTVGDLFTYYIYINLLITPIQRIMSMLEMFQQGWAGFERFQELMDEPIEITNPENPLKLLNPQGNILFDNVEFKYNVSDADSVLKKFDLAIEAGKMVALVGPSGVGKTTIAQLVPRFYDVTAGAVKIDGIDIRSYDLASLRRTIGYVQQDVVIFWGSIRDNIAYGNPEATDEEIIKAAISAGIHEYIISLPEGYQTMVGERGVRLSGGQKQRISLARIFLKDPKILIFDEATSALDNITEAYIQKHIELLAKNRTMVVVAHRLSTVQKADEIIVLDETGVVQKGTHNSLLAAGGHYKELYEASQNGIIGSQMINE